MPSWPLREFVLWLLPPGSTWRRWLLAPEDWLGWHRIVSWVLAVPAVIYLLVAGSWITLAGFNDLNDLGPRAATPTRVDRNRNGGRNEDKVQCPGCGGPHRALDDS
ncbi:MAG TPA: hypothetical protein VNN10_00540 [Dehalococcoidia bacterium]|nr:hypothetical protein [Dehalococcoidia bacterium]